MHTNIGPGKSIGIASPLFTSRSPPPPISCRAFPTRPPPTMMEGITLVAVVAAAMEVIIVLEIDVGEEYLRLKRELGLVQ